MVGLLDNFLRPLLIRGRVHIHNFYLFFGILGGIYLMGFTGILLGPILVSLSLTVLRIYQERLGGEPPRASSAP
jgi:predicted PurR-regulated permease PerM